MMPRIPKDKMAALREIAREMDRLIGAGEWTEEAFRRLRKEAHEILPDHDEMHGFLLRAAKDDWLGPAYRARVVDAADEDLPVRERDVWVQGRRRIAPRVARAA